MEMVEDGSDCSVVELELPPKSSPPCIFIEEEGDDVILNLADSPAKVETSASSMNPVPSESDKGEENAPDHWTVDMIRFYDDDWGDEESFLVHEIQRNMDKNPNLWKVSEKDILCKFNCKDKRSKIKCFNCCQPGHIAASCPDPLRVRKCYMCGGAGHEPKSCPRSKCLNCGASTKTFVDMCNRCIQEFKKTCSRCKLQGHYFINCSDHWRKFHLTTSRTIRIPPPCDKPGYEQWCCNCGTKGHHEIKCRWKKSGRVSETFPFVASYEDLFFRSSEEPETKEKRILAKKRRYFDGTTEDDSNPLHKTLSNGVHQDDEVTVVYESTKTIENKDPFIKNWKRRFFNRKANKKNKDKPERKKEKGRNKRRKNLLGKWKDLFKHQKRKKSESLVFAC